MPKTTNNAEEDEKTIMTKKYIKILSRQCFFTKTIFVFTLQYNFIQTQT